MTASSAPGALILLPPSEGKADGGSGPSWRRTSLADGPLGDERARLVDALTAALNRKRPDHRGVLRYGSDRLLAEAVATDREVDDAPTLPAAQRYTGVVLDGVDLASADAAARERFESAAWFVSGLWGVVAATDPLPDYRVPITAKLPRLGVVGTWWRPRLSPVLDDLARGRLVWNLLTIAHGRMWDTRLAAAGDAEEAAAGGGTDVERDDTCVAEVSFVLRTADGATALANYDGKRLKGRFVRHLIDTDPADLDAAMAFRKDGFRIAKRASRLAGPRLSLTFVRRT